uniref:SCP domain-containing protein n=1 Tax=Cyprinus carpio carpio TaxID=630221 RepID=A0A9J7ZSU6_CYPCA
ICKKKKKNRLWVLGWNMTKSCKIHSMTDLCKKKLLNGLIKKAYAAKCIWDHNPQLEELSLGENLFQICNSFLCAHRFQEHVDYDFETNNCPEDKMCGHYTQMVWADSNRIGCATHFCDTLEGLGFKKATLLVCDYYPTMCSKTLYNTNWAVIQYLLCYKMHHHTGVIRAHIHIMYMNYVLCIPHYARHF